MSGKKLLGMIIALVVIVGGILYAYIQYQVEAKADKIGMADSKSCKNDEDKKWVKIPIGHYKDGTGVCVEGKPPAPP